MANGSQQLKSCLSHRFLSEPLENSAGFTSTYIPSLPASPHLHAGPPAPFVTSFQPVLTCSLGIISYPDNVMEPHPCFQASCGFQSQPEQNPSPGELDLVKLLDFSYPEPLFSLSWISMHADFPHVSWKSRARFYLRAFALAAPVPGCPYLQISKVSSFLLFRFQFRCQLFLLVSSEPL